MPPKVETNLVKERIEDLIVRRQNLETRAIGKSVIASAVSTEHIEVRGTGADAGTGDVSFWLKKTGIKPGLYNQVKVDEYGRVIQGFYVKGSGSGATDATIWNQSVEAQAANFWISGNGRVNGSLVTGSVTTSALSVTGAVSFAALTLGAPLPVSSGGTGAASVAAKAFFAGPISGVNAAPGWRDIAATDLPPIPFDFLVGLPDTLQLHGIADAYTKTQVDSLVSGLVTRTTAQTITAEKTFTTGIKIANAGDPNTSFLLSSVGGELHWNGVRLDYSLPMASSSVLGGVTVGNGLQVEDGRIRCDDAYLFRAQNSGASGVGNWTKILTVTEPNNTNGYISLRLQLTTAYYAVAVGVWHIDIEPRNLSTTSAPTIRMIEGDDNYAATDVVVVIAADYPASPKVYEIWTRSIVNYAEVAWTIRDLYIADGPHKPYVTYHDDTVWEAAYTAGTATAGTDARNTYVLPAASASVLGGVKIGSGLSIDDSSNLSLSTTGVTSGTYGSSSSVGSFTVDSAGRLTEATAVAIAFPVTSVFGRTGEIVSQLGDYNTDQVSEGSNLYFTNSRVDARIVLQKGVANGIASLDAGGKVPISQLPATAIVETFVVATQAAMLALTAQQGDVCIRTDIQTSFILRAEPASTLTNWQMLLSPADGVTSVALSAPSIFTVSGSPITASGTLSFAWNGTNSYIVLADGSTVATSSYLSAAGNPDLVAIEALAGTSGLLKKTAANTWALDTNTYLTGNQSITLSGDVSGTGATAITTTLASIVTAALNVGSSTVVPVISYDAKGRITGTSTASIAFPVTSVFGRTGAVVAASGDYNTAQVTESTNLYFTTARAQAAISATAPLAYSAGVVSHLATDGNLHVPATSTTNSGKALVAGATAGSIAWTQLTTSHISGLTGWATKVYTNGSTTDVAEGTNLYFTNARAIAAATPSAIGAEPALGNPSTSGYVLSSTTAGVRSWVALPTVPVTSVFGRTGTVVAASGDYTTTLVTEGTNLYFTTARVLATALTGYAVGTNTALAATDTILAAFGKVQAQINARPGTVTSVGLSAPANMTASGTPVTSSGTLGLAWSGASTNLVAADGSVVAKSTFALASDAIVDNPSAYQAIATYALGCGGGFRATGYDITGFTSNGPGVEVHYDSANTRARILGYNRTSSARIELAVDGSPINFYANGTLKGAFDSSGNFSLVNLTASRALVSDASKNIVASSVTSTELGYVSGVTSSIQTQLNAKQATLTNPVTGTGVANQVSYWSATNTQAGSPNFVFDGTDTLSVGVSSSATSLNPRVNILQYTGTAGGGELYISAAGTTSDENSAKVILNGGHRLLGLTTSEFKLQRWNSTTSAWATLLGSTSTSNASLDMTFYGVVTAASGFAGNASSATKLATARTLTIGSTGKSFDGTGDVSWSLAEIGAQSAADAVVKNPSAAQWIVGQYLGVERATAGSASFANRVTGDSYARLSIIDNVIKLGAGTTAEDVFISRSTSGSLSITASQSLATYPGRGIYFDASGASYRSPRIDLREGDSLTQWSVESYYGKLRFVTAYNSTPVVQGTLDASGNADFTGSLKLAGTQRISSAGRFDASSLYNSAWAGGGIRPLLTDNSGMGYATDAATFRGAIGAAAATDLSAYLPLIGGTISGSLSVNVGLIVGTGTGGAGIYLDSALGNNASLDFRAGGVKRWSLVKEYATKSFLLVRDADTVHEFQALRVFSTTGTSTSVVEVFGSVHVAAELRTNGARSRGSSTISVDTTLTATSNELQHVTASVTITLPTSVLEGQSFIFASKGVSYTVSASAGIYVNGSSTSATSVGVLASQGFVEVMFVNNSWHMR